MSWLKRGHRNRVMSKSFPTEWLSFIQRNVPFYQCLPPGDQSKLQKLELKSIHPDLYEQLRLFYRRDPASLFEKIRRETNCAP